MLGCDLGVAGSIGLLKFLVGKDGKVFKRYAPTDTPASRTRDIEAAPAA